MGSYVPLCLTVEDSDDLDVVAACLQDSLVPLGGVTYDAKAKDFRMIANRFCWECECASNPEKDEGQHQRVLTGVTFHDVKQVSKKGFDLDHQNELINLLTIRNVPDEKSLHLIFSGGAEIKIKMDSLKCYVKDLEAPYPTSNKPDHG